MNCESISESKNSKFGELYVVATPIGNMEDITFRALRVLSFVDLVIAEDTRVTTRLLLYHGIRSNIFSMNEYNENSKIRKIINKIKLNMNVALVSTAGTPLISDPGTDLLWQAIVSSINIVPIPGVSALITSLSVAGINNRGVLFLGFPPKKKEDRINILKKICDDKRLFVFYESPIRVLSFLEEILENLGNRYVIVSREMTKIHEEFIRGKIKNVLCNLNDRKIIRGEFTLLIYNDLKKKGKIANSDVNKVVEKFLNGDFEHISKAVKKISSIYEIPKRNIYQAILKMKKKNGFF